MKPGNDVEIVTVTPVMAEKWLNKNEINRSLRDGLVERYADDMKTGRWTQCSVPISFYDDGNIADGQHRLYAIIESGKPQRFIVLRGLSRIDGLNIDTHGPRTLIDNARIAGVHAGLSNALISVCRAVDSGERSKKGGTSNARKMDYVTRHEEAARWAIEAMGSKKGLVNALSTGCVARAWYHEADKERLAEFCQAFTSGFTNGGPSDSAAVAIRNYMLAGGYALQAAADDWTDTWKKFQNAIYYFMRGRSLKVIKAVGDEVYPLPKRGAKGNGHA